jgi:hypothetical protein
MRAEPERQGRRFLIGFVRVRAPGRAPIPTQSPNGKAGLCKSSRSAFDSRLCLHAEDADADRRHPRSVQAAGSTPAFGSNSGRFRRVGGSRFRNPEGALRARRSTRQPSASCHQDCVFTASRAIRRRRRGAMCATLRAAMVRGRMQLAVSFSCTCRPVAGHRIVDAVLCGFDSRRVRQSCSSNG